MNMVHISFLRHHPQSQVENSRGHFMPCRQAAPYGVSKLLWTRQVFTLLTVLTHSQQPIHAFPSTHLPPASIEIFLLTVRVKCSKGWGRTIRQACSYYPCRCGP